LTVHLSEDGNNAAISSYTIIGLGKSLELEVVAVGVETEVQLNYLINNGCGGLFQGYLFGNPESLLELERKLFRLKNLENIL
jgi:EAL domain-containing protein (putative c-di-GMP-specific phosphodiesterase class I)